MFISSNPFSFIVQFLCSFALLRRFPFLDCSKSVLSSWGVAVVGFLDAALSGIMGLSSS